MPDPLPIQAKRSVKLQVDVDRAIAARVDATVKQYDVPRAAVIRAALSSHCPRHEKTRCQPGLEKKNLLINYGEPRRGIDSTYRVGPGDGSPGLPREGSC